MTGGAGHPAPPARFVWRYFGSSACVSEVIFFSASAGLALPFTTVCRWSLITSVILRPLSPGKAYHLVSSGSWLTAV